jgi:hypothetical protein
MSWTYPFLLFLALWKGMTLSHSWELKALWP